MLYHTCTIFYLLTDTHCWPWLILDNTVDIAYVCQTFLLQIGLKQSTTENGHKKVLLITFFWKGNGFLAGSFLNDSLFETTGHKRSKLQRLTLILNHSLCLSNPSFELKTFFCKIKVCSTPKIKSTCKDLRFYVILVNTFCRKLCVISSNTAPKRRKDWVDFIPQPTQAVQRYGEYKLQIKLTQQTNVVVVRLSLYKQTNIQTENATSH